METKLGRHVSETKAFNKLHMDKKVRKKYSSKSSMDAPSTQGSACSITSIIAPQQTTLYSAMQEHVNCIIDPALQEYMNLIIAETTKAVTASYEDIL
ncbi:hypothetical protein O6P43_022930 [Quillaja saponaria]|uniref:Uncharacterized protein n=1 Tax=Quillaja saponaria TaxID=32244 RepID=A0AAD7LE61_QUISA|nr:hypothetical protein O6P43_022930 [Quillaja saponaria]